VKAKLQGKLSDGKHGRLSVHGRPLVEKNRGRKNWRSKMVDVYTVDCRESRRVVVPSAGQNGRTFLRLIISNARQNLRTSVKHPKRLYIFVTCCLNTGCQTLMLVGLRNDDRN
jgi:hypothetical protein